MNHRNPQIDYWIDKMLTTRQKMFAKYYVANGFNGAKAARDAGYSKIGSNAHASRLLSNDSIKKKCHII